MKRKNHKERDLLKQRGSEIAKKKRKDNREKEFTCSSTLFLPLCLLSP